MIDGATASGVQDKLPQRTAAAYEEAVLSFVIGGDSS